MHYRLSTNVAHLWINDFAKNAIIFDDNSTFSLGFPSFLRNNDKNPLSKVTLVSPYEAIHTVAQVSREPR